VAKKSHTKTKQVIAKNALAASFLAPKALMQAGKIHQNKNNLTLNLNLLGKSHLWSLLVWVQFL
jgi:hypothetical protein